MENETPFEVEAASPVKYVARQPILDRHQKLFGYELLFRSGIENFYDGSAQDPVLSVIGDGLLFHAVEKLTDDCKAFVNFSREALLGNYTSCLPREVAVIEVLASVEPDAEVLQTLKSLVHSGYSLCLDNVSSEDRLDPFLELLDFGKIDMTLTAPEQRHELVRAMIKRGVVPIAGKIETQEQFREMAAMGCEYFQGFFFAKPQMISRREIGVFKPSYLRLLRAINRPQLDVKELERLIKHEEAFCYKLLRYLNSPVFGFHGTIRNIGHAILLLGESKIKRWATMVAVTTVALDRPQELVLTSLRRAFFCEQLASETGLASHRDDLFLLGLMSLIDALLDRPREDILAQLPLDENIKRALLDGDTRLASVLHLVQAYDQASWSEAETLAGSLKLSEPTVVHAYTQSLRLSYEALQLR